MKLVDKDIAGKIAKDNGLTLTKLGLRFDKVVVRLLSKIRMSIEKSIPQGTMILLTITSPIKRPSKTEIELCKKIEELLNAKMRHSDYTLTLFTNKILIRAIDISINQPEKLIGFVHNPECDSKQLLDFTVKWLEKN